MAKLWSRASSDNRDAIYIYHSSSGLELCMILLTGERWRAGASMFVRLSLVSALSNIWQFRSQSSGLWWTRRWTGGCREGWWKSSPHVRSISCRPELSHCLSIDLRHSRWMCSIYAPLLTFLRIQASLWLISSVSLQRLPSVCTWMILGGFDSSASRSSAWFASHVCSGNGPRTRKTSPWWSCGSAESCTYCRELSVFARYTFDYWHHAQNRRERKSILNQSCRHRRFW